MSIFCKLPNFLMGKNIRLIIVILLRNLGSRTQAPETPSYFILFSAVFKKFNSHACHSVLSSLHAWCYLLDVNESGWQSKLYCFAILRVCNFSVSTKSPRNYKDIFFLLRTSCKDILEKFS